MQREPVFFAERRYATTFLLRFPLSCKKKTRAPIRSRRSCFLFDDYAWREAVPLFEEQ
jgi:hypothetical protein